MGKRWIALILAVVMLFDVNPEMVYGFHVQDAKETQTQVRLYFYDENGTKLSDGVAVIAGSSVELNDLAKYYVPGYQILWKDQISGEVLENQVVVSKDMHLQAVLTPVKYVIVFDKNAQDAEGSMPQQEMMYGEKTPLTGCVFTREGYVFDGWALTAQGERTYEDLQEVNGVGQIEKEGDQLCLYATWREKEYSITYHVEDGENDPENPATYYRSSETIKLKAPTRKGYAFEGWYASENDQEPVTEIQTGSEGNLELYAKWKKETYTITYHTNGGKLASTEERTYVFDPDADFELAEPTRRGYTFAGWYAQKECTTKIEKIEKGSIGDIDLYAKWTAQKYKITYQLDGGKNHAKNPKTYTIESNVKLQTPTKKGYFFLGWYTDKKYKTSVNEIKTGTIGEKTFYAKWEKEYAAKADSAKITTCKAWKKNTVLVEATVGKRISSSDGNYYLVQTTKSGASARHRVASCKKQKKLSFQLDTTKNRGYALARYAIAIKNGTKYQLISKPSDYISNPGKLAYNTAKYQYGKTKKGLQTSNFSDIVSTGAHNMFMNVNISDVINPNTTEPEKYQYNGKTYTFAGMGGYLPILRAANARNVNVTVQINLDQLTLTYAPQLIAKEARQAGHLYYAWEVMNNTSREYMEAIFSFLAEKFGQTDCYVSNWILGNELNSCDVWCYRGSLTDAQFVSRYAFAFRCLYNAVKSVKSVSKVYTCVDSIWNRKKNETCGMTSKAFLERFAKYIKSVQKDVAWDIAIHPYSVRIDYPGFWDPVSYYRRPDLVQNNEKTGYITMKNLKVFTKYVKRVHGNKSIIISEIGFDSRRSKKKQAAALAYAYNIAACDKMIDAFIIRSFVDEPGDAGFCFGIKGRGAYSVFKYMDTNYAEKYTKKYLGVIGKKKKWNQLVSGYTKEKIVKNWRS
ncbi:MAG: DUF5722 domain-containing protein [Lachnospiraceae bacterium]